MEVLSPALTINKNSISLVHPDDIQIEKMKDDNVEICVTPIPDEKTSHRIEKLTQFFIERIFTDVVVWIPGFIFVYSTVLSERGNLMTLVIFLTQVIIVTLSLYNSVMPFLPDDYFESLVLLRSTQTTIMVCVLIVAPLLCLKSPQMSEYFLKASMVSFISDIALWKVTQVMYTEERLENYQWFLRAWFLAALIITVYRIGLFLKTLKDILFSNSKINSKKSGNFLKKKKENKKINKLQAEESTINSKSSPVPKRKKNKKSKKEDSFAIVCQYKCIGVINVGYVSVNCTDSCFNQYHLQCWSRS